MTERLYRSRGDRMIFGVAAGMARYFKIDSSIVRLLWVLLVLAGGAGLLLYIVAAIVIPEEPAGYAPPAGEGGAAAGGPAPTWGASASGDVGSRDVGPPIVLGAALILLGGWFLLQRFVPSIDGSLLWPLALVGLGVIFVVGAMRRQS
ncbi:MAG TPA: PspC domain-containing protein [Nonomuraea sp.]|nr:PspC domain-containing protein [Nonomuraea sp.]